ncbi:MAG TPA: DUF5752 family protein [Candidatus Eisenbacteria bacterium]
MTRPAFHFSTVAHLEYPAGPVATDLATLRDGIASVQPESLFYHITRVAVRHPRARDLPPNDFANWTGVALQDPETAERLALSGAQPLVPLEELRASLVRILDEVRGRKRPEAVAEAAAFHFISARSVKAPLDLVAEEPEQVVELWSHVDASAAFYHLVEARVLGVEEDDLVIWLHRRGAQRLAECAESLTLGGMPLLRLHREIGARWRRSLIPSRLVRRTEESESVRRQEARAVVARFAGRLRKPAKDSK